MGVGFGRRHCICSLGTSDAGKEGREWAPIL